MVVLLSFTKSTFFPENQCKRLFQAIDSSRQDKMKRNLENLKNYYSKLGSFPEINSFHLLALPSGKENTLYRSRSPQKSVPTFLGFKLLVKQVKCPKELFTKVILLLCFAPALRPLLSFSLFVKENSTSPLIQLWSSHKPLFYF